MMRFKNMKNSRDASILPKIIFAPAAVAAAVLALGVQVSLARGAGGDGAFFPLLVWGGIVNIVILVSGSLALCLVIRGLFRRLRSLENLLKPLSEKDYTALAALSGTPVSGTDAAVTPLRESLAALGKFLAVLNTQSSKKRELKDALDGEAAEQDMVLHHMEETIDTIVNQFSTIETWSKEGLEALENLEAGLRTLSGMTDGRSLPPGSSNESGNPEGLSRPAELSNSLVERLRESADRAEKVKEAVDTGEDQAREAAVLVKAITKEIENIAGIIKIINQISEQTNILSMNAAIESAHAGQAGAGFAVVADEIRKLADSTRENAGRIYGELKEITGKTGGALKASEDSFQTFSGVSGETNRLAKDLAEIFAAAAETGAPNGEPEPPSGNNAPMPEWIKENISGMMVHCQAFRTALEQIGDLSGRTRTGVREIHSGAREILGNIHATRMQFLRYLEETADPEKFLPSPAAGPAVPSAGSALSKAGGEPLPAGVIPGEDHSDGREVAVKKPPWTIP
jgi:methyl-accepting chemotaxis protein